MKHPDWYFKYFDKIFSRKAGYDFEIQLIKQISSLNSKRVLEIGSGTGEHARRLLNENIEYIELVDFDPVSIDILKREFASRASVKIRIADGFEDGLWDQYDLVIVMYSIILLNIEHPQALSHRLDTLLQRLSNEGVLIFEVVDRDISAAIYKEGDCSVLFDNGKDNITVKSSYSKNKLNFTYFGQLDNKKVEYRASLIAISKTQLFSILSEKPVSDYGSINIDDFGRRLLVFARK